MSEYLAELKDGGIVDFSSEGIYYDGGCSTCDYGSHYVLSIDVCLSKNKMCIETDTLYDYAITMSDFLKIVLRKAPDFGEMTEMEFLSYIGNQVLDIVSATFKVNGEPYFPRVVTESEKHLIYADLFDIWKTDTPCGYSDFRVKGIPASVEDFGRISNSEKREKTGCGNREFYTPRIVNFEATKKYGITDSEFWEISKFFTQFLHVSYHCDKCKD